MYHVNVNVKLMEEKYDLNQKWNNEMILESDLNFSQEKYFRH